MANTSCTLINIPFFRISYKTVIIFTNFSSKSYDLLVLCLGANSPIYQKISGNRKIQKNYKEHSITCSVNHQIKNIGAQQFFLKEGPLAILPYNKIKFSVVWSIEDKYYLRNKKNISNYLKSKLEYCKVKNLNKNYSY